jgi:hypothetical protein
LGLELILSLELSKYRRAKVWLDEPPPASFVPSSIIKRSIMPRAVISATRRIAAIEMAIPSGPTTRYALIGAELFESPSDGLEVDLCLLGSGALFAPSLAARYDTVHTGLPEEYSGGVLAGVEKVASEVGMPSHAILRFAWAAHGSVGSSRAIFERVSVFVVRLFTVPETASRDEISAIFD